MLTEAETNFLIDLLLKESNSATFATMLAERLNKSPARYTDSPKFEVQLKATFAALEVEGVMVDLLAAIAASPIEELPSRSFAISMLYRHHGGGGLQRLLLYSEFDDPGWDADIVRFVMGHVCMVEIDGLAQGTGVLIGPDQVLTAYHVVDSLLEKGVATQTGGTPGVCTVSQGSAAKLKCRFDFAIRMAPDGSKEVVNGTYLPVAQDWLGPHSPPHVEERSGREPPEVKSSHTLDYALITLDSPAGAAKNANGLTRGWSTLAAPVKPLQRFTWLCIIQHPYGAPVKAAKGYVTAIGQNSRLRYYVSASLGSSGAPCWNKEFKLVAMHNMGGLASDVGKENQGVPVALIIDHIKANFSAYQIPAAYKCVAPAARRAAAGAPAANAIVVPQGKPIWSVSTDYPVLDRVYFQSTIQQMCGPDGEQILRVNGTRYSGRSFSEKIAKRFLKQEGHTVHSVSAIAIAGLTPEQFINDLCLSVGLNTVNMRKGAEFSTRASVVQRHLLTDLLAYIKEAFPNSVAAPRQLWIIVDALDQATLVPETLELLLALVQRVEEAPGLRVVLIGYEPDLPPEIDALLLEEAIAPVNEDDIHHYLQYVCSRAARWMPDDKSLGLAKNILNQAPGDPAQRLRMIAQNVRNIARKLQGMVPQTRQQP